MCHLYFFSVELTATSLIASYSREQAEPAAVACSGPRWMKHICHSTKAVSLGKWSKLTIYNYCIQSLLCLKSRSTALPCPSCFQEKVLLGSVENHQHPQPLNPVTFQILPFFSLCGVSKCTAVLTNGIWQNKWAETLQGDYSSLQKPELPQCLSSVVPLLSVPSPKPVHVSCVW